MARCGGPRDADPRRTGKLVAYVQHLDLSRREGAPAVSDSHFEDVFAKAFSELHARLRGVLINHRGGLADRTPRERQRSTFRIARSAGVQLDFARSGGDIVTRCRDHNRRLVVTCAATTGEGSLAAEGQRSRALSGVQGIGPGHHSGDVVEPRRADVIKALS